MSHLLTCLRSMSRRRRAGLICAVSAKSGRRAGRRAGSGSEAREAQQGHTTRRRLRYALARYANTTRTSLFVAMRSRRGIAGIGAGARDDAKSRLTAAFNAQVKFVCRGGIAIGCALHPAEQVGFLGLELL